MLAGTALALGATSTVLWLESNAEFDELAARCAAQICMRGALDTSSVETLETAHHVTLALALGAGAGAIALFFLEDRSEAAPAVQFAFGPGAVGARGRF